MRSTVQFAIALISFVMASGAARAESAAVAKPAKTSVKRMVREAHTPDDYRALASYFRMRQQEFKEQADSEIEQFARRSLNVSLAAAKYPTPLDSSRNRYEYFNYEADRMSRQAAHYEALAANN